MLPLLPGMKQQQMSLRVVWRTEYRYFTIQDDLFYFISCCLFEIRCSERTTGFAYIKIRYLPFSKHVDNLIFEMLIEVYIRHHHIMSHQYPGALITSSKFLWQEMKPQSGNYSLFSPQMIFHNKWQLKKTKLQG